jgi:hypothetical protein
MALWLEDLLADQAGVLAQLVLALEPELHLDASDPSLALRIRRDASPWMNERRQWLERITERVRDLGEG